MSFLKSVNLEHAQSAVSCNVCEDDVPGEYYCIECKQTLCPQCEKNHRRVASTKNHNIVLRAQVGDIDTTTLSCAEHEESAACHCEKCNIPVCIKCITGKHKGHGMSHLADILEKEKKMLQDDIEEMQRVLPGLRKQQKQLLTEKEIYKRKIKTILKDMESEKQAVMKEIQRMYKERENDVIGIQDSHLSVFDGLIEETNTRFTSYEKRLSEYMDTVAKNNLPALIRVTKGRESISEIREIPELPDPPKFVPGNLQSVVENLGKLNISCSSMSKPLKQTTPTVVSKFQCPLQGFPSICITKEGDVWLGGYHSRELIMVGIKGEILRRRKIQNRPKALAVIDCCDVILSPRTGDSRSVSRLLKDDREQHVYDTSPYFSIGVSVTADQKILICTGDGRVVRINCDGTNVKQIYNCSSHGSALHAVENAEGNIYINDWTNLAVVSKDGKVLSTITGEQQLEKPFGLVVDKMDNILCADIDNNCVYIIDQNQKMRELVGPSHGIQKPRWLAVDNDNNLWITQNDGTIQVVKYLYP